MKKGTKVLGTLVLAVAAFSLYLGTANLLFWVGAESMPLEGRPSSDLMFPFIIFSLLGPIMVNNRRRLESAQSSPHTN